MGRLRPVVFILAVCGASLFIVSYLNLRVLTEKDFAERRAKQNTQVEVSNSVKTLDYIDKYQKQYFDIIKRNDVLLLQENNGELQKDEKQLSDLFDEIKSKIKSENPYLLKYNDLVTKYSVNTGQSTFEMNEFAQQEYEAVDALLNEVYQAVISTLTDDEAEALKNSEIKWIKDVEAYNDIFESKDYGTINYIVKVNYESNMRRFRTLLLMLYLN